MSGSRVCDCAFGPRCESNRGCADDDQTMGFKDRRTGEIKKRAEWSVAIPLWRGPGFRLIFMCDECWQAAQDAQNTPLLGIDRPEHASEFWRPSITEHIRLTQIKNEHDEKMREASEAMKFAPFSEKPMTSREREMTPERWKLTLFIRQKFREHARRDGAGS
jgi:1,4-alpha-glucan branching enzyme